MPAAARVGDLHVCPLSDGPKPHVGGPIMMGNGTVLIDGQAAATVGSICTCIVGGQPIARVGDMTAHGGVITSGSPTVDIGG